VALAAEPSGVISRTEARETRARTESLGANDCVLPARDYYDTQASTDAHAKARECFEQAVQDDPAYSEA
jgi:hypothetical protein